MPYLSRFTFVDDDFKLSFHIHINSLNHKWLQQRKQVLNRKYLCILFISLGYSVGMVFVKYAVFTDLGIVYVLSIAVISVVSELEIRFRS